jgi:23S rRNA (cytidine1920-2'-O)/16S rRNA (cytidine1409-2'-O)-methyltransferase
MILAGEVTVDDATATKPGVVYDTEAKVEVAARERYVSRAGDKLASVAERLQLDFAGKVVLDVGSSTGGFTDFALQHGAARVYCVDVGTDQLAAKIRADSRVVVMEQTDIREAELPEKVDLVVIDVSFISLTKILNSAAHFIKPNGQIIAMMKPQFEAGREIMARYGGVLPAGKVRDTVTADFRGWLTPKFEITAEAESGLAGTDGNLEHFFSLRISR